MTHPSEADNPAPSAQASLCSKRSMKGVFSGAASITIANETVEAM